MHDNALNATGILDLVELDLNYIEDWSSGSCPSDPTHGGLNGCVADRFQLCAEKTLPAADAWPFIHCNFQFQKCLMLSTAPSKYPNCYEDHVLSACAGDNYDALKSCASNATSAEWMQASAKIANAKNGGHPSWVTVDGTDVTDDSKGNDAWGKSVLTAICSAATKKSIKTPDACN